MYQMDHLSHNDALALVEAVRKELEAEGKGAAVAIVDHHGELLAFLRTDGCLLASITIAINKAFTAARERRQTAAVGDQARNEGFPLTNFGDLRYVGWGGGVPIFFDGQCVGGIGVSGLAEQIDIDIAQRAIQVVEHLRSNDANTI
jgi:glc operon protein GlcG